MKTLRAFLCIAALLVAFATQGARADDSDSVGSGPVGPVESESESAGPVGSSDSSETVLVAKAGTGKATQVDRWLIVALIAGSGNGKGFWACRNCRPCGSAIAAAVAG